MMSLGLTQAEWGYSDVITLVSSDGVMRLGGDRRLPRERAMRWRQYREEDYMDPQQRLCLGALFDIAATNGLDSGRRVCVVGFCRSIEMLSDVVQDMVADYGGEVMVAEKVVNTGSLNEKLRLSVALPLLWGVPPALDSLSQAIRSGGGIVDKVYSQWEFL
eukprot:jgi/Mesen1/10476/ME000083S09980